MKSRNGSAPGREEMRRRVLELLHEQAVCLREVFKAMDYSDEENRAAVRFFLLRKDHLMKLVDQKLARVAR